MMFFPMFFQFGTSFIQCGGANWRAANEAGRRKTNLDETGLEICGCRHELAQRAVSMFVGEIYGYVYSIQSEFMIPNQVEFFWEDVVCFYWPWLMKRRPDYGEQMKPALSLMHVKLHSPQCRVRNQTICNFLSRFIFV